MTTLIEPPNEKIQLAYHLHRLIKSNNEELKTETDPKMIKLIHKETLEAKRKLAKIPLRYQRASRSVFEFEDWFNWRPYRG